MFDNVLVYLKQTLAPFYTGPCTSTTSPEQCKCPTCSSEGNFGVYVSAMRPMLKGWDGSTDLKDDGSMGLKPSTRNDHRRPNMMNVPDDDVCFFNFNSVLYCL